MNRRDAEDAEKGRRRRLPMTQIRAARVVAVAAIVIGLMLCSGVACAKDKKPGD